MGVTIYALRGEFDEQAPHGLALYLCDAVADLPPDTDNVGDLAITMDSSPWVLWGWDGAAWQETGSGGGGVTDHGALTGLGDDDHSQYALADGTRGDFDPLGVAAAVAAAAVMDGDPAGGVLNGNYPNPGFAADMATQAELDTHKASADHDGRYYTETETDGFLTGKQASDADLTAIAALDSSTAGAIASDGAGWIKKTYAQFKTALGLVKGDVGLGNVDNTSDVNKPVSTAQQTALDLKIPNALVDAKGDLLTASANDTPARLAVGADFQDILVPDSSQASGLKWRKRIVRRSADSGAVTSNTTPASDDTLLWAVAASEVWFFELWLRFAGDNNVMDFKAGWSVPALTTMEWGNVVGNTPWWGAAAIGGTPVLPSSESQTISVGTRAAITQICAAYFAGFVTVGANAGNVNFQWAQNTSDAGNLKVMKNSFLRLERLA